MRFNQMTEEEKLEHLNRILKNQHDFIEEVKGTGISYYSSVSLRIEEFEWIMDKLNNI